jgi:hypothetical protein
MVSSSLPDPEPDLALPTYTSQVAGIAEVNHHAQLVLFLLYWSLNSGLTPSATPPALFFCEEFFEIGSHELFVRAGFKPQSS